MLEPTPMAKDKTFNLRLDAADRARLDKIAKAYSAPAATAIRILIKNECDRLENVNWSLVAKSWARDMHVSNFESRFGTAVDRKHNKIVLYDNNPWSDDPKRRERQVDRARKALEQDGLGVLGVGTYPELGEDAGYTLAVIFDAGEEHENRIAELYQAAIREEATV